MTSSNTMDRRSNDLQHKMTKILIHSKDRLSIRHQELYHTVRHKSMSPPRHTESTDNTPSSLSPGQSTVCPICLEDMRDLRKTPCNHIFCSDCYTNWFTGHNSCPLCRQVKPDSPKKMLESKQPNPISSSLNAIYNQALIDNWHIQHDGFSERVKARSKSYLAQMHNHENIRSLVIRRSTSDFQEERALRSHLEEEYLRQLQQGIAGLLLRRP